MTKFIKAILISVNRIDEMDITEPSGTIFVPRLPSFASYLDTTHPSNMCALDRIEYVLRGFDRVTGVAEYYEVGYLRELRAIDIKRRATEIARRETETSWLEARFEKLDMQVHDDWSRTGCRRNAPIDS